MRKSAWQMANRGIAGIVPLASIIAMCIGLSHADFYRPGLWRRAWPKIAARLPDKVLFDLFGVMLGLRSSCVYGIVL